VTHPIPRQIRDIPAKDCGPDARLRIRLPDGSGEIICTIQDRPSPLRHDLDPFPRRPRGWEGDLFAIDSIGDGDSRPGSGMIDRLLYGLGLHHNGTIAPRRDA